MTGFGKQTIKTCIRPGVRAYRNQGCKEIGDVIPMQGAPVTGTVGFIRSMQPTNPMDLALRKSFLSPQVPHSETMQQKFPGPHCASMQLVVYTEESEKLFIFFTLTKGAKTVHKTRDILSNFRQMKVGFLHSASVKFFYNSLT